tara:strand:- start:93 stop:251 length:159 start_codon:yes stop_codon:yes gene_type:complete
MKSKRKMYRHYYSKFRQWWFEHDSIEIVLFASLFACLAWGVFQVALALIDKM